jgi:ABC-2 type transport system permease protein
MSIDMIQHDNAGSARAPRTQPGDAAASPAPPRVTLGRVIRSEWIKLRSLRSPAYLLAATAATIVAMAAFTTVGILVAEVPASGGATADPLGGALTGISPAELVVAVFGVLAVTGEYASGSIASSLTAVPRRVPLVLAKALVVASAVFTVTLAAVALAFLAARTVLATTGVSLSIAAPGALRALVGAALYLAVVSVLAVGFGWLLRSTAGALAVLFGLLYVLPVVGLLLPQELGERVLPYLPGNAGTAIMQLTPSGMLSPGVGLAVFAGYAGLAVAAAAFVLKRRDA